MAGLGEGWGWPRASRKAHYFGTNSARSLCRRWLFTGPREQGGGDAPENCAKCRKALKSIRPNGGGEC